MACFKKIMKVVAIIAAIGAAAAGVYLLIKKLKEKKAVPASESVEMAEVPCACEPDEPIVVEDQPEEAPAEEAAE